VDRNSNYKIISSDDLKFLAFSWFCRGGILNFHRNQTGILWDLPASFLGAAVPIVHRGWG